MRIYLSSMAHPKRLSKRLAKSAGISLNRAQQCCAVMFGYNDWHELEQVTAAQLTPPSKPDYLVSAAIVATRRQLLGERLFGILAPMLDRDWSELYDLMDELDPTGCMPAEASFLDARLDTLFPREWRLNLDDPERLADFDVAPELGFVAEVGMHKSRFFEGLLTSALKNSTANSPEHWPRDDMGYRTFAFDFGGREAFADLRPDAPSVAAIPFRFVPTIQENVLTDLELIVHSGAFASNYLADEHVAIIVDAILEYLHASRLACYPDWAVCGSLYGVNITLSGSVQRAAILRIMEQLAAVLEDNAMQFTEAGTDSGLDFLPVRQVTVDFEENVSEDDLNEALFIKGRDEFARICIRDHMALSRAPEMLAEILIRNGFAQYAEFASAMSLDGVDAWKKFGAFVCSMERAKTISPDQSLFFRHYLAERVVSSEQPATDSPDYERYIAELEEMEKPMFAAAARSLGDEALARRYEANTDEVFSNYFEMLLALEDIVELLAQ